MRKSRQPPSRKELLSEKVSGWSGDNPIVDVGDLSDEQRARLHIYLISVVQLADCPIDDVIVKGHPGTQIETGTVEESGVEEWDDVRPHPPFQPSLETKFGDFSADGEIEDVRQVLAMRPGCESVDHAIDAGEYIWAIGDQSICSTRDWV